MNRSRKSNRKSDVNYDRPPRPPRPTGLKLRPQPVPTRPEYLKLRPRYSMYPSSRYQVISPDIGTLITKDDNWLGLPYINHIPQGHCKVIPNDSPTHGAFTTGVSYCWVIILQAENEYLFAHVDVDVIYNHGVMSSFLEKHRGRIRCLKFGRNDNNYILYTPLRVDSYCSIIKTINMETKHSISIHYNPYRGNVMVTNGPYTHWIVFKDIWNNNVPKNIIIPKPFNQETLPPETSIIF